MSTDNQVNNRPVNLSGAKIIEGPTQSRFQDLPANPRNVQQALALLAQIKQAEAEGPKLATPGNPCPERRAEELGGVLASFLYNNAGPLLEAYLICQTEYMPLAHGLGQALARGPFGPRMAQAVVEGFMAVSQSKPAEGEQEANAAEAAAPVAQENNS